MQIHQGLLEVQLKNQRGQANVTGVVGCRCINRFAPTRGGIVQFPADHVTGTHTRTRTQTDKVRHKNLTDIRVAIGVGRQFHPRFVHNEATRGGRKTQLRRSAIQDYGEVLRGTQVAGFVHQINLQGVRRFFRCVAPTFTQDEGNALSFHVIEFTDLGNFWGAHCGLRQREFLFVPRREPCHTRGKRSWDGNLLFVRGLALANKYRLEVIVITQNT